MRESVTRYHHIQKGPISIALLAIAVLLSVNAWLSWDSGLPGVLFLGGAALFLFLAMCFRQLTVKDEGEWLRLRFGPLPVFGTRIPYSSITAVETGRTSLIDGLGIHYAPLRGWTYNLWGSECAVIHLGDHLIRVGSDDVASLVNFLHVRVGPSAG
jgi:hypothetical protein